MSQEIGLTPKEVRRYSLANVVRAMTPGTKVDASFEREISDAIAKQIKREPRGFFIPAELQRDWNIAEAVQGGNLVPEDYRPGSFIDLLRDKMVLDQLGVQFLTGLSGDLAIPKQTGTGQAYWVAEGNAPTEQSGSVSQVTLSPKTIGAFQDYTRKMMLQASPAIEGIVRADILAIIARGVQLAVFHGSGSNNQPQGIEKNATVTASALLTGMANFSQTSSTDLEAVVADANYGDASFKYVMRPGFAVDLKSRPQIGTTYPKYIVEGNAGSYTMNGYPVITTNAILSGFMFFGDFSNVWIGEWGTLDLTVDPYALATSGGTRLIGLYDVDVAIRHPEGLTFGSPVS